jgi:polyether ionophore transport system permease protein
VTGLAVAPRSFTPVGRHPERVVAALVSRRALRSGLAWGSVFALYVVVQAFAYVAAYKTQAARDRLADAFGTNIGINALIGPARTINTVAGYTSWRALGVLSLMGGLWGLLTSTRLLRGEEEDGRTELLLVGHCTRRAGTGQALLGIGVGLSALFAVTSVGTILTGASPSIAFGAGASAYFAVTLVAGAATFLAVGALMSQLFVTRRRAATVSGAVFGAAYALRMVGDSDRSLHFLVWLSPLGWIEESRPLTDPHPAALIPVVALVAVCVSLAMVLAGRRDIGASTITESDDAPARLSLLGGPFILGVRLSRAVAVAWLAGVAAMSVLIGTVAESATKAVSGSAAVEAALGRIGGHGSLVLLYLGLTFLLLSLMITLIAAGQVNSIRAEEATGRVENLLVRPVRRISWFSGRLAVWWRGRAHGPVLRASTAGSPSAR